MAECTISRCSQERRTFRKEFQRWSRSILFVVGFERIAEEYMGRHRWKHFSTPFTELETKEPVDWSPDDICYFCESKKNPPYDPASGLLHPGEDFLRIDVDDQSVSSDQGIGTSVRWSKGGSSSPAGSLDQPLDLSLTSGRKDHENGLRPCSRGSESESDSAGSFLKVPHISMNSGKKRRFDPTGKRSYTEDELQAALRDIQSGKLGTRRAAVIYGIPRSTLRNKVYKMSNDRDRGRRKTTKASAVAGKDEPNADKTVPKVPQSPLGKKSKDADTTSTKRLKATGEFKNGINSSASESLRQLLKHTIIQKSQAIASAGEEQREGSSPSPVVKEEADEETPVNGEEGEEEASGGEEQMAAYQWLSSQKCSPALAPVLAQMLSNIQHLALSKGNGFSTPKESPGDLKLPLLPELIRRLAEEKLESACSGDRHKQTSFGRSEIKLLQGQGCPPDVSTCTPLTTTKAEEDLSNVILKIPSFKPTKSSQSEQMTKESGNQQASNNTSSSQNSGNSSRGITVSLKELIARSINQRMGSSSLQTQKDETSNKAGDASVCTQMSELGKQYKVANDIAEADTKKIQESTRHCVLASMLGGGSSSVEKRSRPKRGRYRNYDTDNLAQAVRAVQKGEMSVHRAGTYYGVPHSTLEYKVKERHLLRPKKRDCSVSSLIQQHSSRSSPPTPLLSSSKHLPSDGCKILNGSGSSPLALPVAMVEADHHQVSVSGDVPSVMWQGLPFFPVELAGNNTGDHFFASQMMKRLQESVRLQQQQEVRGHLLEGLIKATLEKAIVVAPPSPTVPVPRYATAANSKKTL